MRLPIQLPSAMSVFAQFKFQETCLATGTAFTIQDQAGCAVLATARHNARGRDNNTNRLLSKHGGIPDRVELTFAALDGGRQSVEVALVEDGTPTWLEHPRFGSALDLVALPLPANAQSLALPYDPDPEFKLTWLAATEVAIVGFPFGLSGGPFGVWVRGSTATEPIIDYDDLPLFLVDARTRSGQSGAPVILYEAGNGVSVDVMANVHVGTGEPYIRLLGIYSGRTSEESDLGFVWKTQAIVETINEGVRPERH